MDGKTYYVDLVKNNATSATVWFRAYPNACSRYDIRGMELVGQKLTLRDAGQLICRAKAVYDGGKTVAGCAATVGTGICGVATVPSGGTAAAVCGAVVTYTVSKGFADCLYGISDLIAAKLGYDRDWSLVRFQASVGAGQWATAIDKAIDAACADVKR